MLAQRALEGAAESQDLLPQATALVARILDVPLSAVLAWEPREHTLRVTAGVGWRAGVVGARWSIRREHRRRRPPGRGSIPSCSRSSTASRGWRRYRCSVATRSQAVSASRSCPAAGRTACSRRIRNAAVASIPRRSVRP
jgi:hypothetical protein